MAACDRADRPHLSLGFLFEFGDGFLFFADGPYSRVEGKPHPSTTPGIEAALAAEVPYRPDLHAEHGREHPPPERLVEPF